MRHLKRVAARMSALDVCHGRSLSYDGYVDYLHDTFCSTEVELVMVTVDEYNL